MYVGGGWLVAQVAAPPADVLVAKPSGTPVMKGHLRDAIDAQL